MGFPRGPRRAPAPARPRGPVFAVGRRICVAPCPDDRSARVTLTDEGGKKPIGSLSDGAEVSILGWRPGWSGAARYHVRATASGEEGWLAVANLLTANGTTPSPSAAPAPLPAAPSVPAAGSGRRFGQR